jgi:hypothetical protein
MKVIVAGSRGITSFKEVSYAIEKSGFEITEIVSGTARGVDRLGEGWASLNEVPIKRFPAQWDKYGRGAGFKRNTEMAEYADALVAVWDGRSNGTKQMISEANRILLKVFSYEVNNAEY